MNISSSVSTFSNHSFESDKGFCCYDFVAVINRHFDEKEMQATICIASLRRINWSNIIPL